MKSVGLTKGNIGKLLIAFTLPLFFGNLLQQLYSAVDAIIVGRFVGDIALAAVGSSGPITYVIVSFFTGMSTGSSILISQFFGGKKFQELSDTVHTGIGLAIIMGIVLGLFGFFITPYMLIWMNSPPEVYPLAVTYFQIFFAGLPGLTIYNMGAAIITAMGDSKRPLIFLVFSSILNLLLNLLFVIVFHWGVAGVGFATIIAQAITAVLVLTILATTEGEHKLKLRQIRIHKTVLKNVVKLGFPSAIQGSIISLSNVMVQAYVNQLGTIVAAGYSTMSRVDGFAFMPAQTISMALPTFVAQNLGAAQVDRARKGIKYSAIGGFIISVISSVLVLGFAYSALGLFSPQKEVQDAGFGFLKILVPCYPILYFSMLIPGALRGAQVVRIPTVINVSCFVFLRQLYLFIATQFQLSITIIALSYPITWTAAIILNFIYFKRFDWNMYEKKDMIEESESAI